ncbi:MAG: TonB-dependent receptor [Panacagrimonas sp.]
MTAQKREESLQEVPISIQAFSPESLDARGVTQVTGLGEVVPALQFTDVVGFTLVYLRGVGTDSFSPSSDPSVATYIDGVYLPAGHGVHQELGGIKRVEVLKGPQGTLFGRNSTAGAISIVTNEPSRDEPTVNTELSAGDYSSYGMKVDFSTPLTDWMSIGVAGLYRTATPYNDQLQFSDQDYVSKAARAKLSFHPSENWQLGLTYLGTGQISYAGTTSENTEPSQLSRALGIQPSEEDRESPQDVEGVLDSGQRIFYGNLDWSLPRVDLKLIGSKVKNKTRFAQTDFDGSAQPLAAFNAFGNFASYKTGELQILSNDETWLADQFEWVAGLYYLESTAAIADAYLFLAPNVVPALLTSAGGGEPLPPAVQTFFDQLGDLPLLQNTPLSNEGIGLQFNGILGTKSRSAFVQGTWSFSDRLKLTLGGRYQKERRFLIQSDSNLGVPAGGTAPLLNFPLESSTSSNFSPKVVLTTFPLEDTMVYLSWSKGYKSATYNIISIYQAGDYVEPEEVTSYELGMKSDFFGGLLRLNAAVFQTEIKDLQTGFVSLLAGGAVTLENAGKARIRGAEFDAILTPFPEWNPGLAVTANGAYLDSEYLSFTDGSGFREEDGVFADNLDFTGNEIVRAPEFSGGASLVQTFSATSNSDIELGLDYYYNSGFFYVPQNTVDEPSYSLLGTRVSYFFSPWDLRVTAYMTNALDEEHRLARFQTDFGVNTTLAAPRQYGVRVAWEF